jgi:hypothetical protein
MSEPVALCGRRRADRTTVEAEPSAALPSVVGWVRIINVHTHRARERCAARRQVAWGDADSHGGLPTKKGLRPGSKARSSYRTIGASLARCPQPRLLPARFLRARVRWHGRSLTRALSPRRGTPSARAQAHAAVWARAAENGARATNARGAAATAGHTDKEREPRKRCRPCSRFASGAGWLRIAGPHPCVVLP